MELGKLHVYAQTQWHGEAYIVGDKLALLALRDAIDKALAENKGSAVAATADGEGYWTAVLRVDGDEFYKLALPYVAEDAKDKRDEAVWPESLREVQELAIEHHQLLMASLTPDERAAIDDSERAAQMWEEEVKRAEANGYEPPPPFETVNGAEIWLCHREDRERGLDIRKTDAGGRSAQPSLISSDG